jgi:hypothetical protein
MIERGPAGVAIALRREAPRASPKLLELRGQGGGDPGRLVEQAFGGGGARRALAGRE